MPASTRGRAFSITTNAATSSITATSFDSTMASRNPFTPLMMAAARSTRTATQPKTMKRPRTPPRPIVARLTMLVTTTSRVGVYGILWNMQVDQSRVLEALAVVKDPDLNRDIVGLGFIKDLTIDGGRV